jgi:hypothetical protein
MPGVCPESRSPASDRTILQGYAEILHSVPQIASSIAEAAAPEGASNCTRDLGERKSECSHDVSLIDTETDCRDAQLLLIFLLVLILGSTMALAEAPVDCARAPLIPERPAVVGERSVANWGFRNAADWPALNQVIATATNEVLCLVSSGPDPYVRIPLQPTRGPLVLRWRMRTQAQGPAEVFWASVQSPGFSPLRNVAVRTITDGNWHAYSLEILATDVVTELRLDPANSPGRIDIADAALSQLLRHPLQFERLESVGTSIRGSVSNTGTNTITFSVTAPGSAPAFCKANPGEPGRFEVPVRGAALPFEALHLEVQAPNLPPLSRNLYLHHPTAQARWQVTGNSNLLVHVAPDGSGAQVLWQGQVAAILCPLAECRGTAVPLRVVQTAQGIELRGEPFERYRLSVQGDELRIQMKAREAVTGPGVRVLGELEQGLLAGVELLGRGEVSSSTLDIERSEHIRFEPDPLWLTMPLAAFVTDHSSVAMLWDNPALQPVFSSPNRYDCAPDHLMALKGREMTLRIRVGKGFASGNRLEDAILWAVKLRGLPEPPPPPRSAEAQCRLELEALNVSLRSTNGWLHAKWAGAQPQFFADQASALWRLTGQVPPVPKLVPGGSHVENPVAFFVTGRAAEWLRDFNHRAETVRRDQQPDGSYHYHGKYQRGHFEDTASGWCARPAALLLEHARLTGNAESLAAGLRTLEYMKRFRTPRGAQTWEIPLHTPDLVASAWLVQAYVRGYELSGKAEYLDLARRWALSGLPFVYQWGRYPIQNYATISVLGATDWNGVVWLGLPVQWCGTTYAYALTLLEPHDHSLDWHRLAEGILRAAQQMQYPEGPEAGCLPDSFSLAAQRRLPAAVNPCVLVWLRLLLGGELDSLAVGAEGSHRLVAPFPVTLRAGKATITAKAGTRYDVLLDGSRIKSIVSQGVDTIGLE